MSILNLVIPDRKECDDCEYITVFEDSIVTCRIFDKQLDMDTELMLYVPCNECNFGRVS